ncbi:MAG: 30S ribosomal protein S20 [Myxococcota bacterium]|nr:30S ribosomal protein S20 [Myxococcota bacterium]
MANHKSAIKRIKQNSKQRSRNRYYRSTMRTQLKALTAAIDEGNAETAKAELVKATAIVQRLAGKGIIHRHQAARRISRLAKAVNAL